MQEHCSLCDSSTGRAGRGDDSIYIETNEGEVGPLCEVCHKSINEAIEACCKALAEGQKPSYNSVRDAICPKCGIDTSHEEQTVLRSCSGCGLTYAVKRHP